MNKLDGRRKGRRNEGGLVGRGQGEEVRCALCAVYGTRTMLPMAPAPEISPPSFDDADLVRNK